MRQSLCGNALLGKGRVGILRVSRMRETERRVRKGGKETDQLCSHAAIFRQAIPNTVPGNLFVRGWKGEKFTCWIIVSSCLLLAKVHVPHFRVFSLTPLSYCWRSGSHAQWYSTSPESPNGARSQSLHSSKHVEPGHWSFSGFCYTA